MKKELLLAFLFAGMFYACTNTQPVTQELEPYHYVDVNARRTKMNIALVQTDSAYQIAVKSDQFDSLRYFVRNDTLHICVPKGVEYKYDIELRAPEFRRVEAYLLHSLTTPDTLHQDTMMVWAHCDKKLHLNVQLSRLCIARIHKNVTLAGKADTAYIDGQYAYKLNLDASHLFTKNMYLKATNSNVKLNVSDSLWIQDAFQSKITYIGTPTIMECNMKWGILNNAFFFY